MGVLARFEQRLDSLVNGAFAKAFRAEVQPVEIAGALQRELDDKAIPLNGERLVGPNTFTVDLSPRDHDRLGPYAQPLGAELAAMVREHAEAGGIALLGPVEVDLARVDGLGTGVFRVGSSTTPGVTAQPHRRPLHEPIRPAHADPLDAVAPAEPIASAEPVAPVAPVAPVSSSGAPGAPIPLPVEFVPEGAAAPEPPPAAAAEPAPAPIPVIAPPAEPAVAARPASNPRLVVHGTAYPLAKSSTSVGRGADVDIRIDDPGISRQHATFRLGEPCTVVDLASTNGTFVRGQRVSEAVLADGDEIKVGSTTLVFRVG